MDVVAFFSFFAGLGLLVAGAEALVRGASWLAKVLGLPAITIGLTVVAFGTSFPEMAVSVMSSLEGQPDISLGNVVGSNIFNILGVLGLSSLISPEGLDVTVAALRFDIPVMIVVAIACFPIFFTGRIIARWEGMLFLFYYLAYIVYLIFHSTQHKTLPVFSTVMMMFVIPITLLTLLVTTIYSFRRDQKVVAKHK